MRAFISRVILASVGFNFNLLTVIGFLFGLFVSSESVMSCYVRNLNDRHVHFVDGAEGGYTNAASIIKRKLKV